VIPRLLPANLNRTFDLYQPSLAVKL
jgi:hypothetical protein